MRQVLLAKHQKVAWGRRKKTHIVGHEFCFEGELEDARLHLFRMIGTLVLREDLCKGADEIGPLLTQGLKNNLKEKSTTHISRYSHVIIMSHGAMPEPCQLGAKETFERRFADN